MNFGTLFFVELFLYFIHSFVSLVLALIQYLVLLIKKLHYLSILGFSLSSLQFPQPKDKTEREIKSPVAYCEIEPDIALKIIKVELR